MSKVVEKNAIILKKLFPFFDKTIKDSEPVLINFVEMSITTKCTLKCKKCWHLMPYYLCHPVGIKKHGDISFERIEKVIDRFIDSVDVVENFCLLGGEPLLHPEFQKIIKKIKKIEKIKKIGIITNGTLLPSKEIIEDLIDEKIYFEISDYGEISRKEEELRNLLKEYNIPFSLRNCYAEQWIDPGEPVFRKRPVEDLEQIYSMCTVRLCQFILNGKFFMCPRAAHQDNLNIYRESKDGYVDLMKNSAQDRKKQITELLNKKYINGCNYCNGFATSDRIPAAAQLTAENIKELKEEYGKLKLPKTFYLCAMVGNRILKSIGIRVKRKK